MKEKGSLMTTLTSEEIEELERLLPIAWGPIDSQETAESLRTIDALRKIRARIGEAHALYESNGGDSGWAGEASFAKTTAPREEREQAD